MPAAQRPLSTAATAAIVAAMGFFIGLAGDACHVASGTTHYEWDALPLIWNSRAWFPFLIAASVTSGAWLASRAGLPAVRDRGRADAVCGAALVLALYALTAELRGEDATVSVVFTGALAVAIWAWWDPSPGALTVAVIAAVAGPVVEIALVKLDAASYAADTDGLDGVAPWLPGLYFAAGAVASGLWRAIQEG